MRNPSWSAHRCLIGQNNAIRKDHVNGISVARGKAASCFQSRPDVVCFHPLGHRPPQAHFPEKWCRRTKHVEA